MSEENLLHHTFSDVLSIFIGQFQKFTDIVSSEIWHSVQQLVHCNSCNINDSSPCMINGSHVYFAWGFKLNANHAF